MYDIISSEDIFLQSVVCSVVCENLSMDDVEIYNKIANGILIDVDDIDRAGKILDLIKMNKIILRNDY